MNEQGSKQKRADMRDATKLYLCHFSIDFVHFDTVVDSICFSTNEINFSVVILLKPATFSRPAPPRTPHDLDSDGSFE